MSLGFICNYDQVYKRHLTEKSLTKQDITMTLTNITQDITLILKLIFSEYLKYFKEHINPTLKDAVLFNMDNHSSNSIQQVYNVCKLNGIILLTLPPDTSHKTAFGGDIFLSFKGSFQ